MGGRTEWLNLHTMFVTIAKTELLVVMLPVNYIRMKKKERDEQREQITNENIIGSTIHNLQKERYYNRNNRQRKVYKTHKR